MFTVILGGLRRNFEQRSINKFKNGEIDAECGIAYVFSMPLLDANRVQAALFFGIFYRNIFTLGRDILILVLFHKREVV